MFYKFIKPVEEKDKMRGLPSILSLFRNKFNKFNNTGERMLDSIYHMTSTLLKNRSFGVKTSRFCLLFPNVIMDVIMLRYQICKQYWFINFIAWHYITLRCDIM